jgi:hypothetical protein
MADIESFFRKVVRFVANPSTDWTDLHSRQDDARELALEKSELKAMIERKRRNEFVRRREFDMLRRIRREGLTPVQIAALGGSSRLDDSDARLPDKAEARPDASVKAKIDEIEQQMVGDGFVSRPAPPASAASAASRAPPPSRASALAGLAEAPTAAMPYRPAGWSGAAAEIAGRADHAGDASPALPAVVDIALPPAAAPAPVQMSRGLPPLAPLAPAAFTNDPSAPSNFGNPFAVEVNEVAYDPELDEAVISFANADFQHCEATLQRLTGPGGARLQHAETWLVLFDLYRATGQQQSFESLAIDYAQQFGWSAPQWFSLPKLAAEVISEEPAIGPAAFASAGEVGWVAPEQLDIEAVSRLRSQTLQLPLPWVFDFGRLRSIDGEAAMQLSTLFRLWAGQPLEMRWVAGNRLFQVLAEAAPTGVRDADPVFWLARLEALRLAYRADQFDEAAIDYCVTYEVSPPSWEPARCKVHIARSSTSTRPPPLSMVSEVSTSFLESGHDDEPAIQVAQLELTGQLVGDIVPTLARLQSELGSAPLVQVSCARLIRVDFLAAGDLLNWVLARRKENRSVQFTDAHRLVALFFGAMGINEHAKVQVRKV